MEDKIKDVTLTLDKHITNIKLIIHNPNTEKDFNTLYNNWITDLIQEIINT